MKRTVITCLTVILLPVVGLANSYTDAVSYCRSLGVPPEVVEAIAEIESYKKNGRIYPYVIRINSPYRILGLKEVAPDVYDCKNEVLCKLVVRKLVRSGVKNVDLGAFQINYYYYKGSKERLIENAFNYYKEYRLACEIMAKLFKKYGKTLYAVGRYHSTKRDRMYRYVKKFVRAYRKIVRRERNG